MCPLASCIPVFRARESPLSLSVTYFTFKDDLFIKLSITSLVLSVELLSTITSSHAKSPGTVICCRLFRVCSRRCARLCVQTITLTIPHLTPYAPVQDERRDRIKHRVWPLFVDTVDPPPISSWRQPLWVSLALRHPVAVAVISAIRHASSAKLDVLVGNGSQHVSL
jgi:hypothetical protein